MGMFWNWYKRALPGDMQAMLSWIESEVAAGRMSQAEAEQRRADLEQSLHKVFDAEDDKDKS